jgi:ArsR family transcriptional regulator
MNIQPSDLYGALSHQGRLRCLLLLIDGEICVCDLTRILGESQPNVSRHLAHLRTAGLVADRRDGQWIHYRLNDAMPDWVRQVIEATVEGVRNQAPFDADRRAVSSLNTDDSDARCGSP